MTNSNAQVGPSSASNTSWATVSASTDTLTGTYLLRNLGPYPLAVGWVQTSRSYFKLDASTALLLSPGEQIELYLDHTDTYGKVVVESDGPDICGYAYWRKA